MKLVICLGQVSGRLCQGLSISKMQLKLRVDAKKEFEKQWQKDATVLPTFLGVQRN